MKLAFVLMIVFIVIALGCSPYSNEVKANAPNLLVKITNNQTNGLGVYKFEDNNNICYVLYRYDSGGISCLKK